MIAPHHGVHHAYTVRGIEGRVGLPVDEGGLQPHHFHDQALSLHAAGGVCGLYHWVPHLEASLQGMGIGYGGGGHIHVPIRGRRPRVDGDVGRGMGSIGHTGRVDGDAVGRVEDHRGLTVYELRLVAGDIHVHGMAAGEGGRVHA